MPPVVAAVGAVVATLGVAGTIALGVSLVAAGVAYSAYKDAKKARSAGRSTASQKQMFRSAAAPKNLVLGHAITSGPMHAAAEEGTPNDEGIGETLHILVHIAGHPCEDVTHCWMNDELLERNATSDPNKLYFTHENGSGFVYVYLGNQTSQLDSLNGTPLAGGDGDDKMIGQGDTVAHVIMKSDPEKWPAGLPNIKFGVKGVKVYDPRVDDTVWTDNPALLLRWYRTVLKHGHPIDDSYIASANICDEFVVTPSGGREKRYRCNYAFPCNESPRTVMSNIRASCAGKSLSLIGRHGLTVGAYYGGATTTLTAADIVGDLKTQADVRRRDRYNTVTATYLDPESNWNEVDMPQYRHDGYYALDGDLEITDDLNLECVPSAYQAQRLASIHLLTTREGARLEIPCNLRGFELLPGKTFKLNFPENGWTDVEFMVERWSFVHEKGVTLSVRQHLASNYEFNADTAKVPERPMPPALHDPRDVATVTHLNYLELVDDNVAQALISWQHRSYGSITYTIKIYQDGTLLRQDETKLKQYRLTDGFTAGNYLVEVVATNGYGSSAKASLLFEARAPQKPVGCDLDVGNWSVTLAPVAGGNTNFDTLFDFAFDIDHDAKPESAIVGRARVLTMQNLKSETTYRFAVREVSRWGMSDWYKGELTTTNDSSDILDVIKDKITHEHLDKELSDTISQLDRDFSVYSAELAEIENRLKSSDGLEALLEAEQEALREQGVQENKVDADYAKQQIKALGVVTESQLAMIEEVERVLITETEALAEATKKLKVEMETADGAVLESAVYQISLAKSDLESSMAAMKTLLEAKYKAADNSVLSAAYSNTSQAFANANQALTEAEERLVAKIERGDSDVLAEAKSYTRTAVGYCVDKDGQITDHKNAVACFAASSSNSWVTGPLAEYIRQLEVTTGSGTKASISQLMQAFEDKNGDLVARGAMLTNNDGRISGFVNTNTGETSMMDIIAEHIRLGDYDSESNFIPLLYLDSKTQKMVLKGNLILDDGSLINNRLMLTGTIWGALTLRDGIFPSDATANADFENRYDRPPRLDDILIYRNVDGSHFEAKQFDGVKWIEPGMLIGGDLIALGSISGDRFQSNTTIKAGSGNTTAGMNGYDGDTNTSNRNKDVRFWAGSIYARDSSGNLVAPFWVDKFGNAYLGGNVVIEGNGEIKGNLVVGKHPDRKAVLRGDTTSAANLWLMAGLMDVDGFSDWRFGVDSNGRVVARDSSGTEVLDLNPATNTFEFKGKVKGVKTLIDYGSVSLDGWEGEQEAWVETQAELPAWGDSNSSYLVECHVSGTMWSHSSNPDIERTRWGVWADDVHIYTRWSGKRNYACFKLKFRSSGCHGTSSAKAHWKLYKIF